MIFRLLFWICAAWLGQCHSKAADPLTDAFLPTTRIIGAVSLQKQICDNEKIIPDVVSELIDVDKDVFKEFMAKKWESQIDMIKNASEFYKKTTSVDSKDLDKTLKGFASLTGLKKQESNLRKEFIETAVKSIEKGSAIASKVVTGGNNIDSQQFKDLKALLTEFSQSADTIDHKVMTEKIVMLSRLIDNLMSKIGLIMGYKNVYKDFLSLANMGQAMADAVTVVHQIRGVFNNFENIKAFDSFGPILKEQMFVLRKNIASFEKQVSSISEVEGSLAVIAQLSLSKSKEVFTIGLPNGSRDLKMVEIDLESSWFLSNLAEERKTKSVINSLRAMISTSISIETVKKLRDGLSIDLNTVKSYDEFKMAASMIVKVGKAAIKDKNAEETIGKMTPCIQKMAQTQSAPDLSEIDVIDDYVKKTVDRVHQFQEISENIINDENIQEFRQSIGNASLAIVMISSTSLPDDTIEAWNTIQNMNLHEQFASIWENLLSIPQNPFFVNAKSLKASVLSDALTAADNAKIFDAVGCLPKSATDIGDLIKFGQKLDDLKGMDNTLTAGIPTLTTAVGLSKGVNKAIAELKKTKTESGTQLICNLPKDYPKTAAPLLLFGSLANNIVKIRSSESSILVVTNSTGPVKAAAESVPDSSLVYNQANRKGLLDTLKSVKNVSDSIGKLGMESSDDLLEISKEIKNIKGFVMENSTILTNIADSLAQNSNPDVKNASTDFKVVSNLDLDFSSSSKVKIGENDFEVLFNPLFPPEIIVISAIDRKQLFDSVYPACSAKSSIFQLYKTDEEDGSKICTDTDEFRFTGNEGYQFDETIKIVKKNPCRSSSQCDSEEYCSTSRRCTKKSDACISWDNPKVKCHFHCPSSICVSIDPKEVYCCPKNATKELPSKTCHVDEDCGPKQFCRTNNFGMSNCAEKEKSEEDLIAPTLEEVHMSYRDLPLSNFRRDNKTCDIEILKKFKPGTAFCPGDLIPLGHEHKCFGSVIQDDSSGRCLHPAGFCLKGYCCLQVHAKKDKLPLKPYLSRVECDPDCPLPSDWLFGFCDPVKRKVAFIGEELLYAKKKFEDTAFRKPESCQLNKDCMNQNVCVIIPRFNSTTKEKMSSFECWVNPLRPPTPPDIFKPSLKLLAYLGMILFFIFIDLYKGTPYVEDNED